MSTKPHFSILATSFAGGPRPRNAAVILSVLWLLIFFAALFSPPASVLQSKTLASGQSVHGPAEALTDQGFAALPRALCALSVRLFGYNSFALRLPQALAVAMLTLLGHRWANQAFGARTGFYTAIALLTSVGVFVFTRAELSAVLLSLLLGSALYAFLKALDPDLSHSPQTEVKDQIEPRARRDGAHESVRERPSIALNAGPLFYPAVMWSALALAVLTDALAAPIVFCASVAIFFLLRPQPGFWKALRPLPGVLLLLSIVLLGNLIFAHGNVTRISIPHSVFVPLLRQSPRGVWSLFTSSLPQFWLLNLLWLAPWVLFLPLAGLAALRRLTGQKKPSAGNGFTGNHGTIVLLIIFAGLILFVFSIANMRRDQDTFPAYLPILLLVSAAITRAEQTFSTDRVARRWVTTAHVGLILCGAMTAVALGAALWSSRHPAVAQAVRWTTSQSLSAYDNLIRFALSQLTIQSWPMLRLPALLAILALTFGPVLAWLLRMQRRHIAATTAVAFTSALFLIAVQIAFSRLSAESATPVSCTIQSRSNGTAALSVAAPGTAALSVAASSVEDECR